MTFGVESCSHFVYFAYFVVSTTGSNSGCKENDAMFWKRSRVARMRPIIFLHLPKAAGSSLRDAFRREYRGQQIYELSGNPEQAAALTRWPVKKRHEIDLLLGHQHFGMHLWLRPGARYITMLRDPIDRCISHYFFVLRKPQHHLHQRVMQERMTLYDYITKQTSRELDNDQVRWLNDDGHRAVAFGGVRRPMLDIAKQRLAEEFEVVGLSERFDESLALVADALQWERIERIRVNVTQNRPRVEEVEPRALDAIRACNELDSELYAFAQELFEQRWQARRAA
jgi:hypothetical protein